MARATFSVVILANFPVSSLIDVSRGATASLTAALTVSFVYCNNSGLVRLKSGKDDHLDLPGSVLVSSGEAALRLGLDRPDPWPLDAFLVCGRVD